MTASFIVAVRAIAVAPGFAIFGDNDHRPDGLPPTFSQDPTHIQHLGLDIACTHPGTVFFCTKTNCLAAIPTAGTTPLAGAGVTTFCISTSANCETRSDETALGRMANSIEESLGENTEESTGANIGRNITQKTEENTDKSTDKNTAKTSVPRGQISRNDDHRVSTWATDRCCANGPRSPARR